MNPANIGRLLQTLETELHRTETRRDAHRLSELLHPEFLEFGRSGRRYTRAEILAEFADHGHVPANVVSTNYEASPLSEDLFLLTYTSAHRDSSGGLHRFTRRASIWMRTPTGWQVRFHQGTPTDEGFRDVGDADSARESA